MFTSDVNVFEVTLRYTVQCDVYVDFVRSYVEVVKSLFYCYRKLIVSSAQTKPLTTNILNDY